MKKLIKCLFILFLLLIPKFVFAAELPKDSFAYFLLYPNNTEIGVGNYEEAIHPEEKLLYVGKTNQKGEIVLENWIDSGNIRIEYQSKSVNTNLIQKRIQLREGLDNPKTGTVFILSLFAFLALLVVFVATHHKKSSVLVLLFALGYFSISNVYADKEGFVIVVSDDLGKPVVNSVVKVYAKPIRVELDKAVLFKSGKGNFFDGSTEMFFRLPKEKCSVDEFYASLGEEMYQFYLMNTEGAYRDGYYPGDYSIEESISDGDSYTLNWNRNTNSTLVTIDGNGGFFDFYGRTLDHITFYNRRTQDSQSSELIENDLGGVSELNFYSPFLDFEKIVSGVSNNGSVAVGLDVNSDCSRFLENGVIDNDYVFGEVKDYTYYMCWNLQPDGIYVNNDAVFLGNAKTCFQESNLKVQDSLLSFDKVNYVMNSEMSHHNLLISHNDDHLNFAYGNGNISQFKIIQDGEVLLSFGKDDLTLNDQIQTMGSSDISDKMIEFVYDLKNRCV